jgi:hypothetical protein
MELAPQHLPFPSLSTDFIKPNYSPTHSTTPRLRFLAKQKKRKYNSMEEHSHTHTHTQSLKGTAKKAPHQKRRSCVPGFV